MTLAIPDLSSLTDAADEILGAVESIASALPDDPSELLSTLSAGTGALKGSLSLDGGGLAGSVTVSLTSLQDAIPSTPPELQELLNAVTAALAALEPLKDALTKDGELLDLKSLALAQAGDPTERITELLAPLANIVPPEAVEALQSFVEVVTAFEAGVPGEVEEVAAFVARGFLGVAPDLLSPARAALDTFVSSATSLAPQASVDAAHAAAAALAGDLASARTLALALDPADASAYAPVLTALTAARTGAQALASQVAALIAAFRSGLASLDIGPALASVESALAAVPQVKAPDTGQFVELVTGPIRELNRLVDSVTPEELAAQLRRGSEFAATELLDEGFDELLAMLRKPFEDVGELIADLRLERIHDAFRDALEPVHDALTTVTGAIDSLRTELVDAVNGAAEAVGTLATAADEVEGALNTLASEIQAASATVDLSAFHDQAAALIEELSQSITEVVAEAGEALDKLRELIAQLGEVDLGAASSAATDAIGELTETIAGIDTSAIPDALLSELRSALTALLNQISLDPVREAISDVIDSAPLDVLQEFVDAYDSVLEELQSFSPAGLLEPLQAPFDDALRRLNDLSPAALLDPVVAELQEAKATLDTLTPAALLAPLDAPLQSAKTALADVKPSQLLAPLNEPFAELLELVDKLDGKSALEAIQQELGGWVQQGLGGLQGVGDAFADAAPVKALADAGAGGGPRPQDFGLRPGDILAPVQNLYEKVVELLQGVPIDTLVAAFEHVRAALVGTLEALKHLPAHLHAEIGAAVAAIDVAGEGGFAAGAFGAHLELVVAVDGIDPARVPETASSQHASLLTLTAEADPRAALAPAIAELHGLRADVLALVGSADTGELGSLAGVASQLDALIPPFLREPVTSESLFEALDAFNPKHLADAVNAEFDILMQKLLKFASTLADELPQVVAAWTGRIESGLGGFITGAFDAVHAPLRAQLQALAPASFAADLDAELYDPIAASLDGLSLASIAGPAIETTLGEAKAALDGVITALQNVKASVGAAHQQALAGLTAVSPRSLEADLQEAYAPIAGALGELDLGPVTDELVAQFQRIGVQAADVLQAVLDALKAMVAAIPSGIEGVSVEASAEF